MFDFLYSKPIWDSVAAACKCIMLESDGTYLMKISDSIFVFIDNYITVSYI